MMKGIAALFACMQIVFFTNCSSPTRTAADHDIVQIRDPFSGFVSEGHMSGDTRIGWWREYDARGKLVSTEYYGQNGKRMGLSLYVGPDGLPRSICNFDDGQLSGAYYTFHQGGGVFYFGTLFQGEEVGVWQKLKLAHVRHSEFTKSEKGPLPTEWKVRSGDSSGK